MRFSQLAIQPIKNPPADADTVNHQLLVQAGFVRQLMAGVYTYTNLGLRTLNKIRNVIRAEMDNLGAQEILMPMLHPKSNWLQTGGWKNIDVLFKITSRTGREYALGQSHEEVVTPLMKEVINSYRDLPLAVYQIHWKFRDELRSKSGILRGREFEMKDMYSWHATQEDFEQFYEEVKQAYIRAYKKVGLTAKVTEASGGSFSEKISYEFMVLTDAGR
jgi:prolyl-tRNA synthetase